MTTHSERRILTPAAIGSHILSLTARFTIINDPLVRPVRLSFSFTLCYGGRYLKSAAFFMYGW
uniref:Uncharacterized protein n=1 Tax=Anguilla anguilla TaxID=7936 RepID=A0A0E9XQR8_ANGAN